MGKSGRSFSQRSMFLHSYEHNSLTGDLKDLGITEYDEHSFNSLKEFQSNKMTNLIPNRESAALINNGIVIYDTEALNGRRFVYKIYFK